MEFTQELAREYFDNHTLVAELYFTSDGLAFFHQHDAINHGKMLDDKSVIPVARAEVYPEDPIIQKFINGDLDEDQYVELEAA